MSGVRSVLLKDICNFDKGSTGLMKAEPGEYPLVTTGKDNRSCESYQFDTKAVCIPLVSSTGHGHASLNNIHYQEGKFALGTILVAITAKNEDELDVHFLHLYLSQLKDTVLVPLMKGAANVSLSIGNIKKIEIPLPSLSRQLEIVEKFKSIVVEERELIDELFYQKSLIRRIKSNIYQDAIEGRLSATWREINQDVEPAWGLFKKIQEDKSDLVRDKKIKKGISVAPVESDERPFELPESWEWCRLGDVVNVYEAGKSFKCSDRLTSDDEWGVIKTSAVTSSVFKEDEHKYYQKEAPADISKKVNVGDLIYCRASGSKGLAGKCCLVDEVSKNLLLSDKTPRLLVSKYVSKKYVYFLNESGLTKDYYAGLNTGKSTSMNNITKDQLLGKPFPLPPGEEQEAIVSKVDAVISLCDQLSLQVNENHMHAEELMQAMLKEEFTKSNSSVDLVVYDAGN
jgi:type I restriction enzyme S subunit